MKRGVASVFIGIIGLIIITYFYYPLKEIQVDTGDEQFTVIRYPMGFPIVMLLLAVEVIGIVFGYFAFRHRFVKLGLLGIGLCALCLILLYGYAF